MKFPELCQKCWKLKRFGKSCYFMWEHKKECSKFSSNEDDEEHYKKVL